MKMVEMDTATTFMEQLGSADTSPVVLINRFTVPPECEAEFLSLWQEDAAYMLAHGCLSAQLHKGTAGSNSYINIALWENTQIFARAFWSTEFQSFALRYPDQVSASPHIFTKIAVPGVCVA
ncbi:antibiotic biosynthesis monooxygenase [Mycobacterium sp. 663a-19]|uniref:antibiotic biosynthesis monooxygenase family protein n=1 Tax=Mycobacterium sp. 663a-19 TaxID=2986148 RepID=UPI002D1F9558|nr:antibiotic biosynthesis monooxygenase family protein [Mycobacterium sp. 663a-19]MEB3980066.1 antibiotic biosynthesis monooxygenase [Mycobacterium sp. 663a-19]